MDLSLYGGQDPREIPSYTMRDAAHHVNVKLPTLKSWVHGRNYVLKNGQKQHWERIIELSDNSSMLSFVNLVEVHVLAAIRRYYKVDIQKVRIAIEVLQQQFNSHNPLATEEFATDGVDLFVEKSGLIQNLSSAQLPIQDIIRAYLTRIDRDQFGKPLKLRPFLRTPVFTEYVDVNVPSPIIIDPFVSFGQPTLSGTGVRTSAIAERWGAGDTIHQLSKDYHLDGQRIEEAIRFETTYLSAAA